MPRKDYYAVLEVKPDSDIAEIEKAYKELVDIYSYNSTGTYSLYEDEQRERLLFEIEEAYKVLSNEAKRKQYDNVYLISDYKESKTEGKEVNPDNKKITNQKQKEKQDDKIDKAADIIRNVPKESADGNLLKNLRIAAGMSIKDVAERTRVGVRYIELMEANDYTKMPGRTYVLGFVKLYFKIFTEDHDKFAMAYIKKYDDHMAEKTGLKKE